MRKEDEGKEMIEERREGITGLGKRGRDEDSQKDPFADQVQNEAENW